MGYGSVQKQLISSNGTYTGNNTVNRAIPHGLGRTPVCVMFSIRNSIGGGYERIIEPAYIDGVYSAGNSNHGVTIWDDTNFYVGNAANYSESANPNPLEVHWVAF